MALYGDTTPDKKARINYALAVNLAATASCRQFLEEFKTQFVKTHSTYQSSKVCSHVLTEDTSILNVFHHFEKCPGVTPHENLLLGDDLIAMLDELNIQESSEDSFRSLYRVLSEAIHQASWLEDNRGRSCAIPTNDGGLRDPYSDEITTPEKNKKPNI